MLTMMGMRVLTTGRGVPTPRNSLERSTLKAGSSVFTVWVSEIATAAKDRLAAMWPTACIAAGPKIWPNSFFVMGWTPQTCRTHVSACASLACCS